jgi:hypothetical protein
MSPGARRRRRGRRHRRRDKPRRASLSTWARAWARAWAKEEPSAVTNPGARCCRRGRGPGQARAREAVFGVVERVWVAVQYGGQELVESNVKRNVGRESDG